jgi:pimeloyl-ACP methyl ester carboxylesterase
VLPLYTDVLDDLDRNASALDIGAAAGRIRVPWLLIHGTEDESVRFAEAERLSVAAPSDTRVMPIPGAGHTFGATHPWQSSTPELDTVFDATMSWLTNHLT